MDCSVLEMNEMTDNQRLEVAEFNKKEYLEFLGLSQGSLLSLGQGKFLQEKRLGDLDFTLSPLQKMDSCRW